MIALWVGPCPRCGMSGKSMMTRSCPRCSYLQTSAVSIAPTTTFAAEFTGGSDSNAARAAADRNERVDSNG